MPLQIDLVEDKPAASAELADQRGFAQLTGAAQDKGLAPWGNQPFFQPGQRFSLDHVKTDPLSTRVMLKKGSVLSRFVCPQERTGKPGHNQDSARSFVPRIFSE